MLYIVSTPIGNLEDISQRALRILNSVPNIICERPTHTLKLLSHFKIIGKKLIAYNEANKHWIIPQIIKILSSQDAAFVTDAGTPTVSDPGPELIKATRDNDIPMAIIPGPSALTSAIALTGERMNQFVFTGFWPKKQKQQNHLLKLAQENSWWLIAFEAPHRLIKTIVSISEFAPQAKLILVGEISKAHEKTYQGSPQQILTLLNQDKKLTQGEFVLCVKI
jgi:16S rRNA (cytidine1402-2'-O)-methyltransferase